MPASARTYWQSALPASRWLDSPTRFGLISRVLHWSMAALLFWQFAGMIVRLTVGRHPVTAFMVGSHKPMGVVLLILVLVRGAWGLYNISRRPPQASSLLGRLAALGHGALYALMLLVPTLAVLREYGSGEPFTPWGVPLFDGSAGEIESVTQLGDALHGELAWVLGALILGHILMVLLHQFLWRDATLSRMAGRGDSSQ